MARGPQYIQPDIDRFLALFVDMDDTVSDVVAAKQVVFGEIVPRMVSLAARYGPTHKGLDISALVSEDGFYSNVHRIDCTRYYEILPPWLAELIRADYDVLESDIYTLNPFCYEAMEALYGRGVILGILSDGLSKVQAPKLGKLGLDRFLRGIICIGDYSHFAIRENALQPVVYRKTQQSADRFAVCRAKEWYQRNPLPIDRLALVDNRLDIVTNISMPAILYLHGVDRVESPPYPILAVESFSEFI